MFKCVLYIYFLLQIGQLQIAMTIKKAAGWGTSGFMACFSLLLVRGILRAAGCGLDAAIF
jgi:hypothetical protein